MNSVTGQCLCGGIAYSVNVPLGPIVNCHCSMCRRWHGAAFRTRRTVKKQHFSWSRGEELLSEYRSSDNVTKTFCRVCGSNLISIYPDKPDYIGLPIGGLDQDPGSRPAAHIFVSSKSPWYEIIDDLPQYQTLPDKEIDSVLYERKQKK